MMRHCFLSLLIVLLEASFHRASGADNAFLVAFGKDATADGSVFAASILSGESENDASSDTDTVTDNYTPTLALVAASTFEEGSARPIGARSLPSESGELTETSICEIPQVTGTYRYLEGTDGALLNERQLGVVYGSTCSAAFGAAPRGTSHPGYGEGRACFSVDELARVAAERHSSARDAVLEMGELAAEHGFYGSGPNPFERTAETLIVTDKDEAWVFHILPDPRGSSAIWAARRVPDDSFAVVSNAFVIREIDFGDDGKNFLYSASVFTVAEDLGWWSSAKGNDEPLDFTAVYSDGELEHKYHSGRPTWNAFRHLVPALALPAEYEEWRISSPYPFSAAPEEKVGVRGIADVLQKVASSAEGDGPSSSYILQSRAHLPNAAGGVLWQGTCFTQQCTTQTPLTVGMKSLPDLTRIPTQSVELTESMKKEVQEFREQVMSANLRLQGRVDAAFKHEGEWHVSTIDQKAMLELYVSNAEQSMVKVQNLVGRLLDLAKRDHGKSADRTSKRHKDQWLEALEHTPLPDCEKLGWRCGHHGPVPIANDEGSVASAGGLRGSRGTNKAAWLRNEAWWLEYVQRKADAAKQEDGGSAPSSVILNTDKMIASSTS